MSEENIDKAPSGEEKVTPPVEAIQPKPETPVEDLSEIKSKLDNSYKQRDAALTKLAEYEKREREAELKLLEEQGKLKEAYELRLAATNTELETLKKRNTELSRDNTVREALRTLDFRNKKAADVAFKDVTSSLIQDKDGNWVHQSGASIESYVSEFSKDEDYAFLLKPKKNTGPGLSSGSPSDTSTKKKSLFDMSQDEVMKLALEGKL